MALQIITDTHLQSRFSHLELARMAFEAGVDMVQYRHKGFQAGRDLEELKEICGLAARMGRKLIVNDRTDLAVAAGAQGVHLGKGDGSPRAARQQLGEQAIIGATVHDLDELAAVKGLPVDYIGVGPVFGTGSKETNLPDMGLVRLREICAKSAFPVLGIGGIGVENAHLVLEAGAKGIAVLGAFCLADDPKVAAGELLRVSGGDW